MASARTLLVNYLLEGNWEERISHLNSSRSQQTANSDSVWGTIARQSQSRGAVQPWENLWRCWKKNRNEIIARASVKRKNSSAPSRSKTTSSHGLPGIGSVWPVVYVITSDTSQLGSVVIDSSGTPSLLPVAEGFTDDTRPCVGSEPFLVYDENGRVLNDVSIEEHEFVVSDNKDIVALPPMLVRVPANGSQLADFRCIHGDFPKSTCQVESAEFAAQHVPHQTDCKQNFSSPLVYSACPRTAGTMDINFRCPVVVCDRLDAVCSGYGLQQSTCNHTPTCHEMVIEDVRTVDAAAWNQSALSSVACSSSPAPSDRSNSVLSLQELDNVTSCLVGVCISRLQKISDVNSCRLTTKSSSDANVAYDVQSIGSADSPRSVGSSQCSPLEIVDEKLASLSCRTLCELQSGSNAAYVADQPTLVLGSPTNAIPVVHSVDSADSPRSVDSSQCSLLEVVDEKVATLCCSTLCDLQSGSNAAFAADQPTVVSGSPPNSIPASDINETHRLEAGCLSKIGPLRNHVTSITSAESYDPKMFDRSLHSETQCDRADGFTVDCNDLVSCPLETSRTPEHMPASVGLHGEPNDQFETPACSRFAVNLMGSNDLSRDASNFVCLQSDDASDQVTTLQPVSESIVADWLEIQPDVNMDVQNGISTVGSIEDNELPDASHTNCRDHSQDIDSVFSIEEVCDNNLCDEITARPDSAIGKIHQGHCSVDSNTVTTLPSNRQSDVCDVGSMLERESPTVYDVDANGKNEAACSADIGAGSTDTRSGDADARGALGVSAVNDVSSQSCAIAAQSTRITEIDAVLADVSCSGGRVDVDVTTVEFSAIGETQQVDDGSDEVISGDRRRVDRVDEDQSRKPGLPHVFKATEVIESVDRCIWGLAKSAGRMSCRTETVAAGHNFDNEQSEPVCIESNCSTLHSETKDAIVAGYVSAAIDEVLRKFKSSNLPSNAIQDFEEPVNESVKRKDNAVGVAPKKRGACRLRKVTVGQQSVANIPRPVDGHERDLAAIEGGDTFFRRRKGQTNKVSCRSRSSRMPLGPSNRSHLNPYSAISPSAAMVESVSTEPDQSSLVDMSNNNIVVHFKSPDIARSDSTADKKSPPRTERMETDCPPQIAERMEAQGPAETTERIEAAAEDATRCVQPTVVTPSGESSTSRRCGNASSTRNICRTKLAKQNLPSTNSSTDVGELTSSRTSRARRVEFVLTNEKAGDQVAIDKTSPIDFKRRFRRSANASLSGQQLADCVEVPSVIACLPDKTSAVIRSVGNGRLDFEGGGETGVKNLTNVEIQNNAAVPTIEADQPSILAECRCSVGVSSAVKPCTVCYKSSCTISVQSDVTNFALLASELKSRIAELEQSKISLWSQLHLAKQQASAGPDWYQVCRMTRSDFRKRKYESFEKELTSRAEALTQNELLANKKIRILRRRAIRLRKWSKKLGYESRRVGGIVVARSPRDSNRDIAAAGIPSLKEIMFKADIKPMSFQLDEEELQQQRAKVEKVMETVIAKSEMSSSVRLDDVPADGSDSIECKFDKLADDDSPRKSKT